jgi:uncharacterized peroxidase-related enzyme
MTWIREAKLKGHDLPPLFQAVSLNAPALEALKQLNEAVAFGGSALSRVQEEAIAAVVAAANRCRHEALTRGGFLRRHTQDPLLTSQLLADYTQADLDATDRRMLDFAVKLTREPASVTRGDVEDLRAEGFSDGQVLSIVLVTSLCNSMDRLADGLGVDVPPSYQAAVQRWLTGPASHAEWLLRPKEA